jgi:hypothetical protein
MDAIPAPRPRVHERLALADANGRDNVDVAGSHDGVHQLLAA